MKKITASIVTDLLTTKTEAPAVTIYMPTHRAASPINTKEDQIRFKNLTQRAMGILKNRDDSRHYEAEFERNISELIDNRDFWSHRSESLLICASPGRFECFNLPVDSDEYIAVDDHFHLLPIYGLLHDNQSYYLLMIAQHNPTLFKGDQDSFEELDIGLPTDLISALNIDELHRRSTQFHSIEGGAGAQYHGHGGAKDSGDEEASRFLRIIDHLILEKTSVSLPLVLSGTANELAEFRIVSQHPNIVKNDISGNHTKLPLPQLHELSWQIIKDDVVTPRKQEAVQAYRQLRGQMPGKTADSIAELKDTVDKGQVDKLIVGLSKTTSDTVRDDMQSVTKLVFPDENNGAALDYIARQTWAQSGTVINVDQSLVSGLAMAILRY